MYSESLPLNVMNMEVLESVEVYGRSWVPNNWGRKWDNNDNKGQEK